MATIIASGNNVVSTPENSTPCWKCQATGLYLSFGTCFACRGRGYVVTDEDRAAKRKALGWTTWQDRGEPARPKSSRIQRMIEAEDALVDYHDGLIIEIALVQTLVEQRGVEPVYALVFNSQHLLKSVSRCERLLSELQEQLHGLQMQQGQSF